MVDEDSSTEDLLRAVAVDCEWIAIELEERIKRLITRVAGLEEAVDELICAANVVVQAAGVRAPLNFSKCLVPDFQIRRLEAAVLMMRVLSEC